MAGDFNGPGQATPASLSEYIASAAEQPVRPDRSDAPGPGTPSNVRGRRPAWT